MSRNETMNAERDEMRKAIENFRKINSAINARVSSMSERRTINPKGSTLYSVVREVYR